MHHRCLQAMVKRERDDIGAGHARHAGTVGAQMWAPSLMSEMGVCTVAGSDVGLRVIACA